MSIRLSSSRSATKKIAGYKVPGVIGNRHKLLSISGPAKVLKRELGAPFRERKGSSVN